MAAVLLPSKIKRQKIMDTAIQTNKTSRRRVSDLFFILWAGGAALLSYSLVYMLRKPYTAAAFEDLEVFNMDYKVAVTIVQILGYVVSKFMGIKLISELRREERLRFILMSVVMAELSLVFFRLGIRHKFLFPIFLYLNQKMNLIRHNFYFRRTGYLNISSLTLLSIGNNTPYT